LFWVTPDPAEKKKKKKKKKKKEKRKFYKKICQVAHILAFKVLPKIHAYFSPQLALFLFVFFFSLAHKWLIMCLTFEVLIKPLYPDPFKPQLALFLTHH
jgi:hypothetical protein